MPLDAVHGHVVPLAGLQVLPGVGLAALVDLALRALLRAHLQQNRTKHNIEKVSLPFAVARHGREYDRRVGRPGHVPDCVAQVEREDRRGDVVV